jgi:hypothetical protein
VGSELTFSKDEHVDKSRANDREGGGTLVEEEALLVHSVHAKANSAAKLSTMISGRKSSD